MEAVSSGNGLLYILGGSGLSAILGLLYYALRKTDRALERSSSASTLGQQAIQFTGNNMLIVAALQQAIFMQGNALDGWEDWGVKVVRRDEDQQRMLKEHGWIKEITTLPSPPAHLDLTEFFKNMPGMTAVPTPVKDPAKPFLDKLFHQGDDG